MSSDHETPRPLPPLGRNAHKGHAGRVLVLAGSATMPGAAILCARAAQRGGAGLCAVGCLDASLLHLIPAAAPEAILVDLTRAWESPANRLSWSAELSEFGPHACLVGPGLGNTLRTRALVGAVLDELSAPLVVDADGLNVLASEPESLARAKGPVVITPHPGEAARMGFPTGDDQGERREQARDLARRIGGIVCLKGAGTVVSDGERAEANRTGNPALATAGSGDVLAGLVAAYLARTRTTEGGEWTPFAAARAAVHVHGLAGDLARAELGEAAVTASDLIAFLGPAQRRHAEEC